MKIIFLFLISFSLIVNPTIAYSKSIKSILDKIEFYEVIHVLKINSFEEFLCFDHEAISSQSLGLKRKGNWKFLMLAIVNY